MEQITLIKISPEELKNIIAEAVNHSLNERDKLNEAGNEEKFNTKIMNMEALCEKYKWPKATIYGWVHDNLIPHAKIGRRLYFYITEIENWIASAKRKTKYEIEAEADYYLQHGTFQSFGKKRR